MICEVCTRNPAAFFCECSGRKIYFCKACFPDHADKYNDFEHHLVRADIQISDVAACRVRSQAYSAGKIELQQNLATIDQCCLDLTFMVDSTVQMLKKYLRDQLDHLSALKETLKADIEEAVNEVESTLIVGEVNLRGKYSAYLRNYMPGNLILFRYQFDPNFTESCRLSLPSFTLIEPSQKVEQSGAQIYLRNDQKNELGEILRGAGEFLPDELEEIQCLVEMGFTEEEAKAAYLARGKDLQLAVNQLLLG